MPLTYFERCCSQPHQKLAWLKAAIALALACGFALSWKLWISSRLFPMSPAADVLPRIPFPLDAIWFSLLLGLLVAMIIVSQPRKLILIFLALAGLLALWDQTRWQPWFYQYSFLLAAIGFSEWKKSEGKYQEAALNICRLILVSTYLWSGLQKLNANFIRETWPDIARPLLRFLPAAAGRLPHFLILLVPVIEILIGIGLISRKYRNISVLLAIASHVFVLILLISSGENKVVWPWNIAMVVFVMTLFWQDRETRALSMFTPGNWFHALVLLLFGVLPVLSLVDLWDSYLSSALYSGNTHQAVILMTPWVIDRLPAAVHPHIWENSTPFFLDINRWAYGELNVPVYPEPRVYRRVAQQVCDYVGNSPDIKLMIRGKPEFITGRRQSHYYDCDHLNSASEDGN